MITTWFVASSNPMRIHWNQKRKHVQKFSSYHQYDHPNRYQHINQVWFHLSFKPDTKINHTLNISQNSSFHFKMSLSCIVHKSRQQTCCIHDVVKYIKIPIKLL